MTPLGCSTVKTLAISSLICTLAFLRNRAHAVYTETPAAFTTAFLEAAQPWGHPVCLTEVLYSGGSWVPGSDPCNADGSYNFTWNGVTCGGDASVGFWVEQLVAIVIRANGDPFQQA
ncbi:hypothetical protein CEUSTIGMA_g11830.t1 [Chlamydomonas eustigma]|uniref:Expansin-like EG45 domain-containing protein n=1 Tax=Chlamydomonas eustigma TaxID=1157962 RepID=A0A250XMW9_9CHLO|nr:hypothetical protein CEUSTIGMA_g11830.t1 [Chlamydomonas eustigma]|eukprot:GAX84408.1 hypothetical protein CEUSTIGMA_g11830.t1 [Chlamydomonas eustigma]